jgi:peptidoglycan hydrolase-like protein with peptidoglycan-binding domain
MPASSVRSRALGAVVAAAVVAGLIGAAGAPALAAPEASAAPVAAPPAPTAPASAPAFAGPPAETESAQVVHDDGHDHGTAAPTAPVRQVAPARTATAAAAKPRTPAVPTGLPAGIEALSRYVAQADCDPTTKRGVTALGKLLTKTYPGTSFGGGRACTDHPPSEHYDGRALDWMVSVRNSTQKAQASAVLNWLFAKDARGNSHANARRLGVMYIIWNDKIWGSYSQRWEPYNNCASTPSRSVDTSCHRDHIHFSLSWEGAMGRTSFWTKKVAAPDYGPCRPADLNWAPNYTGANPTPCARHAKVTAPAGSSAIAKRAYLFSGAQLGRGSSGAPVVALQNALGLRADGKYDSTTVAAVRSLQQRAKLRVNGIMNSATWRALLVRVKPAPPAPAPTVIPVRTFNSQTGLWSKSTGSRATLGAKGDVPVPGDYDGNGSIDLAVYRPSTAGWYVAGKPASVWGQPGDVPVPGRYLASGTTVPAVYRPADSTWLVKGSAPITFGRAGDKPVPADYDGDGRTDIAVFTPSTSTWSVRGTASVRWGTKGDVPVPADYDGDGRAEIAIYRPSTGQWRIPDMPTVVLGGAADVPVPYRYDRNASADPAVWRASAGEWRIHVGGKVVVVKHRAGTHEVPALG